MVYFTRLTDIVTCNLEALLREEPDPQAALKEILKQIEEGVAGARRSSQTAAQNEQRIAGEIESHRTQITYWVGKAKSDLTAGDEAQARISLLRKKEVEDLIAALQQQLAAATATREHLLTVLRGLEARLSEARRLEIEQSGSLTDTHGAGLTTHGDSTASGVGFTPADARRAAEIDDELAALKRTLGG